MSNNLQNEASPLLADGNQDTVDVSVESTQCKLLQYETWGYVEENLPYFFIFHFPLILYSIFSRYQSIWHHQLYSVHSNTSHQLYIAWNVLLPGIFAKLSFCRMECNSKFCPGCFSSRVDSGYISLANQSCDDYQSIYSMASMACNPKVW